jgi:hypothetical protein
MMRPMFNPKRKEKVEGEESKPEEGTPIEGGESNIEKREEHTEKTAEQKKKIRCKKWPTCKSEACEYAHPSETVSL